uniref:ABC transporter ATP-binding protein n=1 Tax=Mycobacterium sp. UM_11 TaxID=1638773 RepID=UPI000A5B9E07
MNNDKPTLPITLRNRTDDATDMRARWRFPATPFGSIPIGPSVDRENRVRPAATDGLQMRDVTLCVDGKTVLLERVSFTARPGTLTAVIGPSGAGKSTLAKVAAGAQRPTGGTVAFQERAVHAMRGEIGMVPQDDLVHGRLTVAQALRFAAELRMPADTTAAERGRVISTVLSELELSPHADTRIDKLSGGQRKRVSVAVELLTGPDLLVLDEPTTGLDPALDRSVMAMLRRLADAGRVVVVVTHSLTFLDMCDQVLLLAPGGKTVFCGPPDRLSSYLGASDWADIFTKVCADPNGLHRRFMQARGAESADTVCRAAPVQPTWQPPRLGVWRQTSTLARRQVRLLAANRGYLAFLAVLPFVVGLLPLTVTGHAGLSHLPAPGAPPFEAKHIVALTSFAAILMGTTLTVRDLVGERAVFPVSYTHL